MKGRKGSIKTKRKHEKMNQNQTKKTKPLKNAKQDRTHNGGKKKRRMNLIYIYKK